MYYIVTGRISGDDEDTAYVVEAPDDDQACTEFKRVITADRGLDEDAPAGEWDEVYVNVVAECPGGEPKILCNS